MSEPVSDALLILDEQEIGFTNSSGFLNYSCPDEGRHVINVSKVGYRPASKVLTVEKNSSAFPEKFVASRTTPDSGKEDDSRPEFQISGFRGITVVLFLLFFIRRGSSL